MMPGGAETRTGGRAGLLARLARDTAGNTMAMVAAAIIPLAGMVGSGVDMGRAYLAQSKLQNACDAAALATRRAMGATTLTQAAREEGERFFAFNFPPGTVDAAPVNLVIRTAANDLSVVEVTASTTIPATIMRILGQDRMAIDISCSADQDYVNNDIMLVLDVTGSMNCTAGTNCDYAATEQTNSRLSRVRGATASLYRALQSATGVRTRYGFMPYSMTVNVGQDLNRAWLRNPANYWQRNAQNNWVFNPLTRAATWFDTNWGGCVEERSTISQGTGTAIRISTDVAQADIDTTSTTQPALQWQPYDADATQGETAAFDNLARFCPAPARRLTEYTTEAGFQAQVNASLTRVGGYTNHDLGIMWGARYLSTTGMFSAANPSVFNTIPVEKHIIFMTDGVMTSTNTNYGAYGFQDREDRFTPTGSRVTRHQARFLAACNRARQMGMTIWVIAVDVQAPGDIRPCASGDSRFFQSNGSDLDSVFTQIGRGIGRLRLTE